MFFSGNSFGELPQMNIWGISLGNLLGERSWATLLENFLGEHLLDNSPEVFRPFKDRVWARHLSSGCAQLKCRMLDGSFRVPIAELLVGETILEHYIGMFSWRTVLGKYMGRSPREAVLGDSHAKFSCGTLLEDWKTILAFFRSFHDLPTFINAHS